MYLTMFVYYSNGIALKGRNDEKEHCKTVNNNSLSIDL